MGFSRSFPIRFFRQRRQERESERRSHFIRICRALWEIEIGKRETAEIELANQKFVLKKGSIYDPSLELKNPQDNYACRLREYIGDAYALLSLSVNSPSASRRLEEFFYPECFQAK